ncbi:MAG TPA: MotA/TolQ/ExbB proton channel family protein [Gammaproteobacteria bacterium]
MTTTITSPIVTLTLWLLLLFSVVTWTIVVRKGWLQWRLARINRHFRQRFWEAPDLAQAEAQTSHVDGPLARLARAGFLALHDLRAPATRTLLHHGDSHDVLENSLKQQIQQEQHRLESGLMVLASIGSTAPFVGLFGTVWGIMHALQAIGATGSASLGVVAGPIGEALITTAIGIATAVPAVLAYNYGVRRTRLYVSEMEEFAVGFLRVALRMTPPAGAAQ